MTAPQLVAHITSLLDAFQPSTMLTDELDDWNAEYVTLRGRYASTFRAAWNSTVKTYLADRPLYPRAALKAIVKQSETMYQADKAANRDVPEEPEPEPEADADDDLDLPPEPEDMPVPVMEDPEPEAEADIDTRIVSAPPLRRRQPSKRKVATAKLLTTLQAEQEAQIEALYQLQTSVMASIKKAHKHTVSELRELS